MTQVGELSSVEVRLFAWDADDGNGHRACGVTDARDIANRRLLEAMNTMPDGAKGEIRPARLDLLFNPSTYDYGSPVVTVRRDKRTGALIYGRGR
jgi:hypothetical protein